MMRITNSQDPLVGYASSVTPDWRAPPPFAVPPGATATRQTGFQ
jgi:hypothetical protein